MKMSPDSEFSVGAVLCPRGGDRFFRGLIKIFTISMYKAQIYIQNINRYTIYL